MNLLPWTRLDLSPRQNGGENVSSVKCGPAAGVCSSRPRLGPPPLNPLLVQTRTGSPVSPELSCADEALDADTRLLVQTSLEDLLGLSGTRWSEDQTQTSMKRVVTELLDKHRYVYNGIIHRLSAQQLSGRTRLVKDVATSMFADGKTNWGRVASLVAFGATVCQSLQEQQDLQDRVAQVSQVSQEISSYLLDQQRDWLLQNNSWDGFVEFFREADPESAVRTALMAAVGVAGLGVSLAMLLR